MMVNTSKAPTVAITPIKTPLDYFSFSNSSYFSLYSSIEILAEAFK